MLTGRPVCMGASNPLRHHPAPDPGREREEGREEEAGKGHHGRKDGDGEGGRPTYSPLPAPARREAPGGT